MRTLPVPAQNSQTTWVPEIVPISSIQAQPLRWIWPGRIPLAKLTMLSGDPNLGKSFPTNDFANCIAGIVTQDEGLQQRVTAAMHAHLFSHIADMSFFPTNVGESEKLLSKIRLPRPLNYRVVCQTETIHGSRDN